jgi:hypothetical protein
VDGLARVPPVASDESIDQRTTLSKRKTSGVTDMPMTSDETMVVCILHRVFSGCFFWSIHDGC